MTQFAAVDRADEYVALLRERLPEKTVEHVLSVAEWAMIAAERVGADTEKAGTAGLLHDLCKKVPPDILLERATEDGIDVTPTQRENPKLLHGPVAAAEARRELGVEDAETLEAMTFHTTGKPGLALPGLCLYFADFAEPLRSYPEAREARRLFEDEGLLPALRYSAAHKLRYARMKRGLDPNTEAFRDWLHEIRVIAGCAQ
jgi:predicted HD superfamily hydrolase involved in NAD metabolism